MQDIYAHIEDHLDENIAMLLELVRQPSISAQGIGFDKAPGLVKQMFESAGLAVEVIPVPNDGNPVVLGTSDGASDKTLLFYTHYDVQPPEPLELWESDPFEPERRGDRLIRPRHVGRQGQYRGAPRRHQGVPGRSRRASMQIEVIGRG